MAEQAKDLAASDLIDALEAYLEEKFQETDGAMTTARIADALGWSTTKTSERLRKLFLEGKIESVRIYQTNKDGARAPVSAYKLKKAQS